MARVPKVWAATQIVPRAYGGGHHSEATVIVKAATAKRARELLAASATVRAEPSQGEWRNYWGETGQVAALAVSVSAGACEGVWYSPGVMTDDYRTDPGRKP